MAPINPFAPDFCRLGLTFIMHDFLIFPLFSLIGILMELI